MEITITVKVELVKPSVRLGQSDPMRVARSVARRFRRESGVEPGVVAPEQVEAGADDESVVIRREAI